MIFIVFQEYNTFTSVIDSDYDYTRNYIDLNGDNGWGTVDLVGYHCEYVDLCMIDKKNANGCYSGQKFVIKVSFFTLFDNY